MAKDKCPLEANTDVKTRTSAVLTSKKKYRLLHSLLPLHVIPKGNSEYSGTGKKQDLGISNA